MRPLRTAVVHGKIVLAEGEALPGIPPLRLARMLEETRVAEGLTLVELGARVGRSREWCSNYLRLLRLGEIAQAAVAGGRLSVSHAKILVTLPEREQNNLVGLAIAKHWSTRTLEGAAGRVRDRLGVPRRRFAA